MQASSLSGPAVSVLPGSSSGRCDSYDVAVVGAGIGGSVCAALLARSGFRVILIDKAKFPRSKICGEGLMPAGRLLLENLGLGERLQQAGARSFSALRFHLPNRGILELDFSEHAPHRLGCVLTRESLDQVLVRFAASHPEVRLEEGVRVVRSRVGPHQVELEIQNGDRSETVRARVLVGADGIRSRFRAAAGISTLSSGRPRFALRRLYEEYSHTGRAVEVYCATGAEAYVAPLAPDRARITLLADRRFAPASRGADALYEELLKSFPAVRDRIGKAGHCSRAEATSPVSARFTGCHADRLVLVGDAAGAVDPITGQGMTIALRDAHLAAATVGRGLKANRLSADDLSAYTRAREDYFLHSYHLSRRLLSSLRFPWLAERARLALARSSRLRRTVVALAADPGPETRLSRFDQCRLVLGF